MAYYSKKLTHVPANYPTDERELMVIVIAIKNGTIMLITSAHVLSLTMNHSNTCKPSTSYPVVKSID